MTGATRATADIDDDRISIHATIDPAAASAEDVAGDLVDAIRAALDRWRDGQAAAVGCDAERAAAHERAIWAPGRWGRGERGR